MRSTPLTEIVRLVPENAKVLKPESVSVVTDAINKSPQSRDRIADILKRKRILNELSRTNALSAIAGERVGPPRSKLECNIVNRHSAVAITAKNDA